MWDSSQATHCFRLIRNPVRLRTSILLICPVGGFIVLMNSFTECWSGIVPAVTGRPPAGQGGPEPLSQNAP
ncbi:hypothetical protein GCM10023257_37710 [Streptomyces hyderabadensis]|uniref:Uncharacterized protein n=1 Tax=Streptomyces hyderabadensis TaxID=598549 RepID=A0ABP9ICM6_9ACTN